jgi:hypothetical protein
VQDTTAIFQAMWDEPMSRRGWFSIKANGDITMHGIDHNRLTLVSFNQVRGLGIVVAMHEKGGTHWSGRGMKRTVDRAAMHTLLVMRDTDLDGNRFKFIYLDSHGIHANDTERTERTVQITAALEGM